MDTNYFFLSSPEATIRTSSCTGPYAILYSEILILVSTANFIPVAAGGASTVDRPVNNFTNLANYEVTQTTGDPRIAQLVARISW